MSGRREVATSPAQPLSEEGSRSDTQESDLQPEPLSGESDVREDDLLLQQLSGESDVRENDLPPEPLPKESDVRKDQLPPHQLPGESDPREDRLPPQLSEGAEAVSRDYTPSSTPVKAYRYSDHIHRDRHIFLKGASLGIGGGISGGRSATDAGPGPHPVWGAAAGYDPVPDWSRLVPWGGGVVRQQDCSVDRHGNVFYQGQCVQLGDMALGNQRLPSLHRVQLALSSGDLSHRHPHHPQRFPHLHEQHRPLSRRRPFNEQLNTYVDTQKRIRSVQCLDDLYRASPSPVFPFLATPTPKQPRPPPRPARIRIPVPRAVPPSLSRQVTGFIHQPIRVPGRPAVQASSDELPETSSSGDGAPSLGVERSHSDAVSKAENQESALVEARHVLQQAQHTASGKVKDHADYFLAREGRQGTLGRLFESYPKRMLVIHPGKVTRQRTEIISRSRLNMMQ